MCSRTRLVFSSSRQRLINSSTNNINPHHRCFSTTTPIINNIQQQVTRLSKYQFSLYFQQNRNYRWSVSSVPVPASKHLNLIQVTRLKAFSFSSTSENSNSNSTDPKEKPKKPKKKKHSTAAQTSALENEESSSSRIPDVNEPPTGDMDAKPDIQHVKTTTALSTFVVVKEKTEEAFSMLYIFGILFACLPYTLFLVGQSLFSSSGSDNLRNESFELVKDDARVMRVLGNDIFAKQVGHSATFMDGDGNERKQIIYEIQGKKGTARVDVEMLHEDKEWRMQYCIVSTNYSEIRIVDNRLHSF